MPEELLSAILARNGITGTKAARILSFCSMQRGALLSALKCGSVYEFCPLPTDEQLFSGRVRVNLSSSLCDTDIFYKPEEYDEHIRAVLAFLNEFAAYHFFALPVLPFNDIQIIKSGDRVTVIRSKKPYAAFVFTEPMMLCAFDGYFDALKKRLECDRSEVRRLLHRFL